MIFSNATAELFVPDGTDPNKAFDRTTHLGIGAHQDDLEIMASSAIAACYQKRDLWFSGVVLTNGIGSARTGRYAAYTADAMREVRNREQKEAATLGEYGALVLLDYASSEVQTGKHEKALSDLTTILERTQPEFVFTHNPMDKHKTHVATSLCVIGAMRRLPAKNRPKQLLGCEVWRSLDWLSDKDKVLLDCSANESLQHDLIKLFDSQIGGGKRIDLAIQGRRRANATFQESHEIDQSTSLHYAVDMTPLIQDPDLEVSRFVQEFVTGLASDLHNQLKKLI